MGNDNLTWPDAARTLRRIAETLDADAGNQLTLADADRLREVAGLIDDVRTILGPFIVAARSPNSHSILQKSDWDKLAAIPSVSPDVDGAKE